VTLAANSFTGHSPHSPLGRGWWCEKYHSSDWYIRLKVLQVTHHTYLYVGANDVGNIRVVSAINS